MVLKIKDSDKINALELKLKKIQICKEQLKAAIERINSKKYCLIVNKEVIIR